MTYRPTRQNWSILKIEFLHGLKQGFILVMTLIDLFNDIIPNFDHKETGKFLDSRML